MGEDMRQQSGDWGRRCRWKETQTVHVCVKIITFFGNPDHRSPRCQPELSLSTLDRAEAREGNTNPQSDTYRRTLALVRDALGFRLLYPLMLR